MVIVEQLRSHLVEWKLVGHVLHLCYTCNKPLGVTIVCKDVGDSFSFLI